MGKAIGIDLGTTNTVAAHAAASVRVLQNREAEDLTPSAVCWWRDRLIVGSRALDLMKNPSAQAITSIKRLMGRAYSDPNVHRVKDRFGYEIVAPKEGTEDDVRVILGGREYSPIEISALILKKVKEDAEHRLNDQVQYAVITVPAYFTEKQKWATRKAGELAGLIVQRILDEPTAAAIAFGVNNVGPDESKTVLVFDFGGGTLDVSLLAISGGIFAQVNLEGDMWLGGDDLDHQIVRHILEQIRRRYGVDPSGNRSYMVELKRRAQKAKEQLTSVDVATIDLVGLDDSRGHQVADEVELTRQQFEQLIAGEVRRAMEKVDLALEKVKYRPEDVDHVLLVGGSSMVPAVRRALAEKFGGQKLLMNVDPMRCVAYGAAILASRLGEVWECAAGHENRGSQVSCAVCGAPAPDWQRKQVEPYTVTPQAFGIETVDGKFEVIIEKGTPYPTSSPITRRFVTPRANLRRIRVRAYQGSEDVASKNELQVTAWLELPPGLPAGTPLSVAFSLDASGILGEVIVTLEDGSGRRVRVYPDRGSDRRSRMEKKLEELRGEWERRRFMLPEDLGPKVEKLYEEAIEAANRNDTDGLEQKIAEMERLFNTRPEWALKAEALLSHSEFVIDQQDWLPLESDTVAKLKQLSEELRRAVDKNDSQNGEKALQRLQEEMERLPGLVHFVLALGAAATKAERLGDVVVADRLKAGIAALRNACRVGEVETVKRIAEELASVIKKVFEARADKDELPPGVMKAATG